MGLESLFLCIADWGTPDWHNLKSMNYGDEC